MAMGKKRKAFYKMFTKWSVSYVVISTVAIIVIFFCANRYSQALRGELEYINAVQLEMTQVQMDRNVRRLRTFCSKANMNRTVKGLRQAKNYEELPRYELYELVRELASDMILEEGAQDCYLYFPGTDLLVSGSYYNTSRAYFDIAFESYGFRYEDWYEVIHKDYKTSQIFSLPVEGSEGKYKTVLIKPLDGSNRQTPSANAIMVMDLGDLLRASQWMNKDRDKMCIIDRSNARLVASSALDEETKTSLVDYALENKEQERRDQLKIGNRVVSCISSRYENWDYVVLTEEQAFVSQITELQRLVAGLILVYLGISAAVIGRAAVKNYGPLKNVVDILAQQDENGEIQAGDDAYDYINRSVNKLVAKDREKSSVINRQRGAIAKELFHRLLTESKAHAMIDGELLRNCGIRMGNQACCLLTYRMESYMEGHVELEGDAELDMQEMSWFILQNVTEENLANEQLESVCFREGSAEQVFLIWSKQADDADEAVVEAVKRALVASTEFINVQFKFTYRIALSGLHHGVEQIHRAYREVSAVFDYQKKEEGRGIVAYSQINLLPTDTLLKYPIDVEQRLSHSVRCGNAEEACSEIRKLLIDNQVNCLAPEAMQFLVSNIAASIIRAAGKVSAQNEIPISQKALMEACRQGDARKMQEELERLTITVCQKIEEINRQEKENQKGQLYQEIRKYVEENYSNPDLSVNSIADEFNLQPTYLSKLFKENGGGGEKLFQYIHRVRLAHVKEQLLNNERLEDIAVSCGFGSQRTFLRIFKQYEGLTPTQFKELEDQKRKEV